MAGAAGTTPARVALHTLHQHDAPDCDFSAEKILKDAGYNGYLSLEFEGMEEPTQAVRLGLFTFSSSAPAGGRFAGWLVRAPGRVVRVDIFRRGWAQSAHRAGESRTDTVRRTSRSIAE